MIWHALNTPAGSPAQYESSDGAWHITHELVGFGISRATLIGRGETHTFTGSNAKDRAMQWADRCASHAIGPPETDHRAIAAPDGGGR